MAAPSSFSTPILAVGGDAHGMLITMVTAISAGVLLIVIARRVNLPAIVLLLGGGILLGPEVWGEHAPVRPDGLGEGLRVIVSLAVGLILFEGGLTLDMSGYRTAPRMIKRLLSLGVVTTWIGGAAAIFLITDVPLRYSVLAASLVIVTGPTVIAPLLKRIKVTSRLHSILHWEGVLIDPIGVFIALLCFEYVISGESGMGVLGNLGVRVAAGLGLGTAGGFAITFLVRRRVVPEDMVNIFALACAVLVFGLAELMRPEAGLLAATVAGFVFGITGPVKVKQVRHFKAEITDLLIGMLFILLSARLTFAQFLDFGLIGAALVAIMMLVVRPVAVVLCSVGLDLNLREKLFLSWVAPRGIVAASMASLFAIAMTRDGVAAEMDDSTPKFIETFVYSVIIATIVLQGLSAGPVARLLGLRRPEPTGWLIVGANAFGRRLAWFLAGAADVPVVLVDTNARAVRQARGEGLVAVAADARDIAIYERPELQAVGNVLALTDNEDLNVRICQSWKDVVGETNVFRCAPAGEAPAEESEVGVIVWPRCPRPSLVAGEIQRREARLLEVEGKQPELMLRALPLLAVVDGKLRLDGREALEAAADDAEIRGLYLQREADYLLRALRPELIATLDVRTLPDLLGRLVDLIVDVAPQVPRDATFEELRERETAFPTTLGHGVAVPHAYTRGLTERICAIARVPEGVDMDAPDGEPVRLVFLLLSPEGDPEGHLATLAEIARLVIDDAMRDELLTAASALDVMRVVRRSTRDMR